MKLHKDYEKYINHSKQGALQLIADLTICYDGYNTIDSLKELIEELRAIALLGLQQNNVKELIKDLEKEMIHSREADQFGYAKQRAIEVYHSVIRRLKALVE